MWLELIYLFTLVYVDIGANAGDTATLTFGFGAAVTTARMFDIKVTQLECGNQGG